MKKKLYLVQVLILYIVFTAVTTIAMGEFSFKHSLFLLIDAILLTAGTKLLEDTRAYYGGIAVPIAVLSSAFIIRILTSTYLPSVILF